jgi:hypothetical protein
VRQRMSDILGALRETAFVEFVRLFRPEEGRMGVTVTFIAMLELMKEGLLEIVQAEPYAPIHVRPAGSTRQTAVAADNDPEMTDADAENVAALAKKSWNSPSAICPMKTRLRRTPPCRRRLKSSRYLKRLTSAAIPSRKTPRWPTAKAAFQISTTRIPLPWTHPRRALSKRKQARATSHPTAVTATMTARRKQTRRWTTTP